MTSDFLLLFDIANSKWQTLPREQFLIALQILQGDFRTCLVEIRPARNERSGLMVLLVAGQVVNLYRMGDRARRLKHSDLFTALPGGGTSFRLRVLALTPNTARLVKILLEQSGSDTSAVIQSGQLQPVVNQAMQSSLPVLVHFSWTNAQGFTLLPGGGLPEHHTLFIASRQVLHSEGSLDALYQWQDSACQVRMVRSDESTLAWREYFLHYAFDWLVKYLFVRLETLAGRMLLSEILRDLNFTTSANSWNINVSFSDVSDQAVFSSPQQAGQVYQRLLGILIRHAVPVIGDQMTDMLVREALNSLHAPYRISYEQIRVYALAD
ncbi:MAG: hypothetical protein R6W69_03020 [Anaerolineales bacterium]